MVGDGNAKVLHQWNKQRSTPKTEMETNGNTYIKECANQMLSPSLLAGNLKNQTRALYVVIF